MTCARWTGYVLIRRDSEQGCVLTRNRAVYWRESEPPEFKAAVMPHSRDGGRRCWRAGL